MGSVRAIRVGPSAVVLLFSMSILHVSAVLAVEPAELAEALAQKDYARAQSLARAELESGRLDGEGAAVAYEALARSSAALGREDMARQAFIRLLALRPSMRLSAAEPDEQRSPYLDARGFWLSHPVALQARAERVREGIRVHVTDPAGLAARVRLLVRSAWDAPFVEEVRAPSPVLIFPRPETQQSMAYTLALIDEHGNRLWLHGDERRPALLLPLNARTTTTSAAGREEPVPPQPSRRSARFTAGSVSLAIGVGLVTGGAAAHVKRQQLADRWNRGACSATGETRAERCAAERVDISRFEALTGTLYAAGGVALIAGAVLLLLGPRAESARAARARAAVERCGRGLAEIGVSCTLVF